MKAENNLYELLSISRAAKELCISRNRIFELIAKGELGVVEFEGGGIKIPRSELYRCVETKTRYAIPNGLQPTIICTFNASEAISNILKGEKANEKEP